MASSSWPAGAVQWKPLNHVPTTMKKRLHRRGARIMAVRRGHGTRAKSLHIESRFRSKYLFGRMILSEKSATFRDHALGRQPTEDLMHKILTVSIALLAAGVIPTAASAQAMPDYAAVVAAPDRSNADRETDKRRDPVKLLAFTGVRAGTNVLDMGAGGGYSTELMARAVGPTGVVYGQNAADLGPRARERFEARMKTPAMKRVVSLVRPFDDPLPNDVRDLDLITFFFFYHDTTYMAVDRAA